MNYGTCCVLWCRNTRRNSSCKFYLFPTSKLNLQLRKMWIAAVNRKNDDGSPWSPKPYDRICSNHFIGGKKSDDMASLSYVPSIFPSSNHFYQLIRLFKKK
ncbi:unnamed protein product [Chrysodeixis includens]|uniref:THAP-type domain-containing protein n=1 Tax=Chrysodeixis includens TaxID=689277 RepID=A0A9P0BTI4_CHRIL|nr:unnamed protein product [Chrysodeixis includens]